MDVVGVDLAWQSTKNTSAAAVGTLENSVLTVHELREDLNSIDAVLDLVASHVDVNGLAIDAPLIINNQIGQRACERALARDYGSKKASCHASNRTLYPEPSSVELADRLSARGFDHLASPADTRWQIECYPHPAIIEMFGLAERHRYKKGNVEAKRQGQVGLARLIRRLASSPMLRLAVDARFDSFLNASEIGAKRGAALKRNEDALDAIVCAYVAGLYAVGVASTVYGDALEGYIYVPQVHCLDAECSEPFVGTPDCGSP